MAVGAAFDHQLLMAALLDDPTLVQLQDVVRAADRVEPMAAFIFRSFSGSMKAVASSRTMMGASFKSTRAKAMR